MDSFPEFYFNLGLIVLYLDILDVLYLQFDFLISVVCGWEKFLDSSLDDVFFGVSCFTHSSQHWKKML